MKQITLDELKANPAFDKEALKDTVLRGALVDRCCGCAVPGKAGPKSRSSRTTKNGKEDSDGDDGETNPNRHWHCIREKNTFLHVECDDENCDICEMRQRAATFDALDNRVGSRNLLDSDDERANESRYQVKEAPAGRIGPEPLTRSSSGCFEVPLSTKLEPKLEPMSISPTVHAHATTDLTTFR